MLSLHRPAPTASRCCDRDEDRSYWMIRLLRAQDCRARTANGGECGVLSTEG